MERRKSPRYPICLKVYFPEHNCWGLTRDISLEGCYVQTDEPVSEGFLADLLIEIPIVGILSLKAYIHRSGKQTKGVGMQFVQVRFEQDQSEYYSIYADFLRIMPQLEKIHGHYHDLVRQGLLKLQTFPETERL